MSQFPILGMIPMEHKMLPKIWIDFFVEQKPERCNAVVLRSDLLVIRYIRQPKIIRQHNQIHHLPDNQKHVGQSFERRAYSQQWCEQFLLVYQWIQMYKARKVDLP